MTKADGNISQKEQIALQNFKELLFDNPSEIASEGTYENVIQNTYDSVKQENNIEPKNLGELLSELKMLVGLN